jgi:hypothetical protein
MKYKSLSDTEDIFFSQKIINKTRCTVGLLYFYGKPQKIYFLMEKIIEKCKEICIDTICVMTVQEGFDKFLSFFVSYLYRIMIEKPLIIKPSYELFLPSSTLTVQPNLIPVVMTDILEWKNQSAICVLPGWEFFGLDWILHRWETDLGNFDYNSFLCSPSYPKDIYNYPIHPKLVTNYVNIWVQKNGKDNLTWNFYALSRFFENDFGKLLLQFFYEETQKKSSNRQLYKKLHTLYHECNIENPYRKYIFYRNYSITESKTFHLGMFISQYLSYEGMFYCTDFFDEHLHSISRAFRTKIKMYLFEMNHHPTEVVQKNLKTAFQEVDAMTLFPCVWISRAHLKNTTSPFLKILYYNWYEVDRNIFLWDLKGIRYNDSQLQVGMNISYLYSTKQINNFCNPNYRIV